MKKEEKNGIAVQNIILAELDFKRAPIISGKLQYKYDIGTNNQIDPEKKHLQVTLKVTVSSVPDESLKISCILIGIFILPQELPVEIDIFASVNAPAIIFPFAREIISTTTLKSGIPPVILPTVNFTVLADKKEKLSK